MVGRRPDCVRRHGSRRVQGSHPRRARKRHGPEPQPDSRAARGRPAGHHGCHRRDERQPGHHRRPPRGRRLLLARLLLARAHRGHHAHRRDGRRHTQHQPPARRHAGACGTQPAAQFGVIVGHAAAGVRAHQPVCPVARRCAFRRRQRRRPWGRGTRRDAPAHRDAAGDGRLPRRGRRPGVVRLCRQRLRADDHRRRLDRRAVHRATGAGGRCRRRPGQRRPGPGRHGHGDVGRWRAGLRLRAPVLQPGPDDVPDDAGLDSHAAPQPDEFVQAGQPWRGHRHLRSGPRHGHRRHPGRRAADAAHHAGARHRPGPQPHVPLLRRARPALHAAARRTFRWSTR